MIPCFEPEIIKLKCLINALYRQPILHQYMGFSPESLAMPRDTQSKGSTYRAEEATIS